MPTLDFSNPILAIDCGTSVMSLAVACGNQMYEFCENIGVQQSNRLLPEIEKLLQKANIQVKDLAYIVYNQGPGMFTGLRVGIGVAQGLAVAFNTKLIGVPSLDATAYLMPDRQCVLAAIDARMNEVFYAFFDTKNQQQLTPYKTGKIEDIKLPDNIDNIVGIGNAFGIYKNICNISGCLKMPVATDFITCAKSGRYTTTDATYASLLYVRDKVALTVSEQALQKGLK